MKGYAAWYSISDSIANVPVTVTRPEKSAVIVFNTFGEAGERFDITV